MESGHENPFTVIVSKYVHTYLEFHAKRRFYGHVGSKNNSSACQLAKQSNGAQLTHNNSLSINLANRWCYLFETDHHIVYSQCNDYISGMLCCKPASSYLDRWHQFHDNQKGSSCLLLFRLYSQLLLHFYSGNDKIMHVDDTKVVIPSKSSSRRRVKIFRRSFNLSFDFDWFEWLYRDKLRTLGPFSFLSASESSRALLSKTRNKVVSRWLEWLPDSKGLDWSAVKEYTPFRSMRGWALYLQYSHIAICLHCWKTEWALKYCEKKPGYRSGVFSSDQPLRSVLCSHVLSMKWRKFRV